MMDWQGKRYWLVGASEGLGREVALCLNRVGAEVIVSARAEGKLKALVAEMPGKASYVTVDVTDRASVDAAAAEIGHIDGLVYLAGEYLPMSAAEWDTEKAETMAEVNYLGALRCVGSVIGQMTDRGNGHIVFTGSLSGFRGLPGAIGYGASKASVMYLAESLQAELHKSDIRIQLINSGTIRGASTDKNDIMLSSVMDAKEAGREFVEHLNDGAFKKSFPLRSAAMFRLAQFLPDWAYYRLFGAN